MRNDPLWLYPQSPKELEKLKHQRNSGLLLQLNTITITATMTVTITKEEWP